MDETQLDDIEQEITNKNAVEDRIRNLHKDKKEAEDAKAEAEKAKLEAEAKLAIMEKETNFLNSFSDSIAKYPSAPEFKDKIKEKVMAGYSVEDATVAILHAEGKLTNPPPPRENVAGGSAPNQIISSTPKSVKEMTSNERWDALREAEKRGDLGLT
jgi:hypothetical protein